MGKIIRVVDTEGNDIYGWPADYGWSYKHLGNTACLEPRLPRMPLLNQG